MVKSHLTTTLGPNRRRGTSRAVRLRPLRTARRLLRPRGCGALPAASFPRTVTSQLSSVGTLGGTDPDGCPSPKPVLRLAGALPGPRRRPLLFLAGAGGGGCPRWRDAARGCAVRSLPGTNRPSIHILFTAILIRSCGFKNHLLTAKLRVLSPARPRRGPGPRVSPI